MHKIIYLPTGEYVSFIPVTRTEEVAANYLADVFKEGYSPYAIINIICNNGYKPRAYSKEIDFYIFNKISLPCYQNEFEVVCVY